MKIFHYFMLWVITMPSFGQPASVKSVNESSLEIGIVEHLDENIPANIMLYNEQGEQVNLSNLIDKPTIISFVYFRCPGICSPLMDGISEVMDRMDMIPGKDYQVFTISFDPMEDTPLALQKKKNYLNGMKKKEEAQVGWQFFTGDSADLALITNAMGFKYKKTGKDYIHSASLIFVSPKGKITRYLNGTYFLPFEFKMAVIEASEGKSGPSINKVLQYCYSYDPQGQQYVLNITKVAGGFIMMMALLLFLVLAIKPVFSRKKTIKQQHAQN